MKVVLGWSLVALAIIASFFVGISLGAQQLIGYTMGPAYLLTLLIIGVAIFVARREDAGYKANVTLLMGVLVLLLHAWYAYQAIQVAHDEREIALARPESDRISDAAFQEISVFASGAVDGTPSPAWARYENPATSIELDDRSVALHVRFAELTRRERVRQVEYARESARAAGGSGFDLVTDPVRLMDAGQRQAALAQMRAYRDFLNSMEARLASGSERYFADLQALGLSRGSEIAIRTGYERSVADSRQVVRDQVQQELLALEQAEMLAQIVAQHGQAVQLDGGELKFTDLGVQAEYEQLRERLGIITSGQ